MSAKKSRKSKKKKIAPKTKPRSIKNMMAFIKEQMAKTEPRDAAVMAGLRELIDRAFERDEDIPTVPELATYVDMPYDNVSRITKQMAKKKLIVDISHDSKKKMYVPNEPEYTGDNA